MAAIGGYLQATGEIGGSVVEGRKRPEKKSPKCELTTSGKKSAQGIGEEQVINSKDQGDAAEVDLSIIIPVLDEEESLAPLCEKLHKILGAMEVKSEVIFVDDGSTDQSFEVIEDFAAPVRVHLCTAVQT